MNKFFKIVIAIAVIFLLSFIYYWRGVNVPLVKSGKDINFNVSKGEGTNQISANLHKNNLIKSKLIFETYVWQQESEAKIQAGSYILNPSLSIKEITRILVNGETLNKEDSATIIEGWDLIEIADYFEKKNFFKKDDFFKFSGIPLVEDYKNVKASAYDWSKEYDFLNDKPVNSSLEGYLFPDTYRIFKDAGANEVVKKMLDNFDAKLNAQMRKDIEKQKKTIFEIITMASLIEKEVKTNEDMKIVSGIFWKRLNEGMMLQSDATLSYYLTDKEDAHSGGDLKTDSLFNTYKYKGLPPAPICNPGLNAIKAAIYPQDSPYFFFLSDPKTGKIYFSKTFEEHSRNKSIYLK